MKLRIHLLILSIGLLSHKGLAQHSVSGKFIDQAHRPVPYLDVIASRDDSIARGTLTDSAGVFRLALPDGTYTLSATFLGKKLFEKRIDLTQSLELGTIQVDTDMQLKGVLVNTRKKLIEQKVDRLVFNVANSIAAAGGDALDALRITPGLRVQNDAISMIGKERLRVMVDGRILHLSGEALTGFLQSISADDIKRIEVITTPPARYEAEGNSGLIDIVYKKGRKNAWNANLKTNYAQAKYPKWFQIGTFHYNKDKLSLVSHVYCATGSSLSTIAHKYFKKDQTWSKKLLWKSHFQPYVSGRIALDYLWSKAFLTGFEYTGSNGWHKGSTSERTSLRNNLTDEIDSVLVSHSKSDRQSPIHTLELYSEYKPGASGERIALTLDYFTYHERDDQKYAFETHWADDALIPGSPYKGKNSDDLKIENYTAKCDAALPLKKTKLDFGGKLSDSSTDNEFRSYESMDTHHAENSADKQNDCFEYTENIGALYLSAARSLSKGWDTKLGLRLENTHTRGYSHQLKKSHTHDYTRLFPTCYLTYAPGADNSFALAYTRRIARPSFDDLNPAKTRTDAYSYVSGNPLLQPATIQNLELSFTHKQWINKLYFSRRLDDFSQIVRVDPETDSTEYIPENYINTAALRLKEDYTFTLRGWQSTNTIEVSYARNELKGGYSFMQENSWQMDAHFSTHNGFTLNRAKTAVFSVDFWLDFPTKGDLYSIHRYNSQLNFALRIFFLHKDLRLNLRGNDLFKTYRDYGVAYVNHVRRESKSYYENRNFNISLSYRFGNRNIKIKQRKAGNEEERNRL
ncbi:MAG: TonB-dependent receptor [Flavobacteriales bacterium]